MTVWYKLRC